MGDRLRYGKGKASIEIEGPLNDMLMAALKEVAPFTMEIIKAEIDSRIKASKKDWIVRGNRTMTRKNGSVYVVKQKSLRSVDKFTKGFRLLDGGKTVEGFFRNDAPYAYAITVASYSKTDSGDKSIVRTGKLLAHELMWVQSKVGVPKLIKKLANAYIKEQKRIK